MDEHNTVGQQGSQSETVRSSREERVLLRENRGHVVILTLNRPQARNSLSEALLNALKAAIAEISANPQVYVVILTAAPPAFSAGHDIRELTAHRTDADGGRAYFEKIMALCSEVMQAIMTSPKPFIAAVNGTASAAGCQLVASCDLAVASETAHFSTPGVNIGLFCSTPMIPISRSVSRKRMMEMLLLGGMLPAMMAMQYGLINRVVPEEDLLQEAMRWAGMIASKSPVTVGIGKQAFYQQIDMPTAEAYDFCRGVMADNLMTEDAKEGIAAFLERRTPSWRNA
jgi:enoyl-CoA hydratase/carnithine racemase